MKITVDRTTDSEGNLVFTINVKEPHVLPFSEEEKNALESIDNFTKELSNRIDPKKSLYQDILNKNHTVKEKVFKKILENLKFSIENEFRPKFRPICQEIYNWIHDKQEGYLKTWMMEFDSERTTYYFDNDGKNEVPSEIDLELNLEDDEEDDEEDDDDDE